MGGAKKTATRAEASSAEMKNSDEQKQAVNPTNKSALPPDFPCPLAAGS